MANLIITHDYPNGTILTGDAIDNAVYQTVRPHRFRRHPDVGIYLRGSRYKRSQDTVINAAAVALTAAGHTVEQRIDNTPRQRPARPTAEVEATRKRKSARRVERLHAAAGRAGNRAEARDASANRVLDGIPMGQPVLSGHYSARGDLRRRMRAWGQQDRAADDRAQARRYASLAEAAAANQRHHENGRVTMRRLEEIRAGQRRLQAELDAGVSDSRREWLTQALSDLADKVAHWEAHMAKLAESGEFVPWGPQDFQQNDVVRVEGADRWYPVKRVNKASLSIDGEFGPTTVKWDKVAGRRRDGVQLDAPNGNPWPVELAKKVATWERLQQISGRDRYSEEGVRAGEAQRIAHGLPLGASDPEVAAFDLTWLDEDEARQVIAVYVDIYRRLAAGDDPAAVRDSVIPLPFEPEWRMPDREPEQRLAAPGGYNNNNPFVQVGDLIVGMYDIGADRRLDKRCAGPVVAISDVVDRRERGTWVTFTLADGRTVERKTHMWFAVHPAGTWEKTPEAKAVEVASLTVENAEAARRDADLSCDPQRMESARLAVADAKAGLDVALRALPSAAEVVDESEPIQVHRPDPWGPFIRAMQTTAA
ncbi:DUF3560 domain-containing protein [Micromonospora sp. NPDC049366]|uniref:DUF3560 domain-containing protein n=1 Tax=Micromonospora sp. NPDC049366 TaxID=3364271 RepID=UPI0037AAC65B